MLFKHLHFLALSFPNTLDCTSPPELMSSKAQPVGLCCFQILLTHWLTPWGLHHEYSAGEGTYTELYCNRGMSSVHRTDQISPNIYTLIHILYTCLFWFSSSIYILLLLASTSNHLSFLHNMQTYWGVEYCFSSNSSPLTVLQVTGRIYNNFTNPSKQQVNSCIIIYRLGRKFSSSQLTISFKNHREESVMKHCLGVASKCSYWFVNVIHPENFHSVARVCGIFCFVFFPLLFISKLLTDFPSLFQILNMF